ncbi:MAG: hypothetical protein P4N41_23630 [Negativicutes bacterium]|nr:hypothetical protein [Negativicutes bacterium]
MKRSLIAILVFCFLLSMAGTVLAMPIDINGDIRIRDIAADDTITGPNASPLKKSYWQFRVRVNVQGKIDDDTSFFARFSSRNSMGGAVASVGNSSDSAFDQYGIILNSGNWKYSAGRQTVSLGQGAILSTGYDAAGVDNKFDGLVASFNDGNYKVNIIGGKTDKITTEDAPKWPDTTNQITEWYGMDISTKLGDKVTAGAAYAHSKQDVISTGISRNTWAFNTIITPSNAFTFKGEIAQSNAPTDKKGYFVSGTYNWDKDSFTVSYNNVQKYALDPSNSGIGGWMYPVVGNNMGNAYHGFTYTYRHPMTKSATLTMSYYDLEVPNQTGSDRELITSIVWKF